MMAAFVYLNFTSKQSKPPLDFNDELNKFDVNSKFIIKTLRQVFVRM